MGVTRRETGTFGGSGYRKVLSCKYDGGRSAHARSVQVTTATGYNRVLQIVTSRNSLKLIYLRQRLHISGVFKRLIICIKL